MFQGKEEAGNGGKKPKQHSLFDYIILILDSFFPFIKHITQCADSLQFIKKTWDMLMHKILGQHHSMCKIPYKIQMCSEIGIPYFSSRLKWVHNLSGAKYMQCSFLIIYIKKDVLAFGVKDNSCRRLTEKLTLKPAFPLGKRYLFYYPSF